MEAYTATHAETVEEILQWPWRRFEAFYAAFIKRQVIEAMERRKDDMISALWSNEGFNDDKGSRAAAITEIEESYQSALDMLHSGGDEQEEEIDPDNPFFSSTMRKMKELDQQVASDGTVQDRVAQEADYSKYIDQG